MNLFVGNLASSVTANDLRKLFSGFGTVLNATVAIDAVSGTPLGYGNVYMVSDNAAFQAMLDLDRAPLKGHLIIVREYVIREGGERRVNKRRSAALERRHRHERRFEPQDDQLLFDQRLS